MLLTNLKLLKDESKIENRKNTCETCSSYKLNICTECGCVMPLKWKFEYAECPLKKW